MTASHVFNWSLNIHAAETLFNASQEGKQAWPCEKDQALYRGVCSRSYYAAHWALRTIIEGRGKRIDRHRCHVEVLNELQNADGRMYALLKRLYDYRIESDYSAKPVVTWMQAFESLRDARTVVADANSVKF